MSTTPTRPNDLSVSGEDRTPEFPADDPDRSALAEEVHSRPSERVSTPSRVTWIAIRMTVEERTSEFEQLCRLAALLGVRAPGTNAVHWSADSKGLQIRWERHGEFSSWQFQVPGESSAPFSDSPIARLPSAWLASLPGRTIVAAHALLLRAPAVIPDTAGMRPYFGNQPLVGGEVGGGAAWVFTDFKVHPDGFSRFLILDRSLTERQAGRTLQRLFEIETYRMLALLALPITRRLWPVVGDMEHTLAALTGEIAVQGASDERLLGKLTKLAAQLEHEFAQVQMRFAATRAYRDIVAARTGELRENRVPGIQTIGEFLTRRFGPAMATIASMERRLQTLSERVAQVSSLLSTRVDITREAQSQELLASLNRRAEVQLHLQQAVEGLSIAAIVYYAAGLVAYLAKSLKSISGMKIDVDATVGVAIPVIIVISVWAMRRAHQRVSHLARGPDGTTQG
ncbi:MAG: DUF3422 domain-containing protein [Proteobacteria bacterium]|nr:DUF3422 domain-containing protein [Pseudomonadota bacterium]